TKGLISRHAGVVRQAEFVAPDICVDNGRVVDNSFYEQYADIGSRTCCSNGISPRPLGICRVVDADFAALFKPVQKVSERCHREAFALSACCSVVRSKIFGRLFGAGAGASVVSDVYPKSAISQPGKVSLDFPCNKSLSASRQAHHYDCELLY